MSTPDRSWEASLSATDRVRMVALAVGESRTANWIATKAGVPHETATKHLERLAGDGQLVVEISGGQTRYRPDPVGQYLREVRELYEEQTPDELAAGLEDISEQVRTWREEFGVETPNELRASIGEVDDPEAERTRREVAREWEHLASRRKVVEDALRLHDRFSEDGTATSS